MASILSNLENRFDSTKGRFFFRQYWQWSIYISVAYVLSIFILQRWMRDREKYSLRKSLFTWNVTLSLFSFYGFYITGFELLRYLYNHGWERATCDFVIADNQAGLWSFLFTVSKLPELLDTYFIVLRKQKLIFLHWYHHVTVFIYCWHAWSDLTSATQWFSTMNYFVHAVMYTYYAIRASGRYRPPTWVNMSITLLQLLQMVFGVYVNVYIYRKMTADPDWHCDGQVETSYFYVYRAFFLYSSYSILFIHFFFKTYLFKGSRQ